MKIYRGTSFALFLQMGAKHILSFFLLVASANAWAEKYMIPPHYHPKQAVILVLNCNQILSIEDPSFKDKSDYIIRIVSYALTRSDVYLQVCPTLLIPAPRQIDLRNPKKEKFDTTKNAVFHNQPEQIAKRMPLILDTISRKHQEALQHVGGKTHQLWLYSSSKDGSPRGESYPYVRDDLPLALVSRDFQDLFFISTHSNYYNEKNAYPYLSHFLSEDKIQNIPKLPKHIQPSSLAMDQKYLFMSKSILEQTIKEEKNMFFEYLDIEDLVAIDININEITQHLDTTIKFVKNKSNKNVEVLLTTTTNQVYETHDPDKLRKEVQTYHDNKKLDRKNIQTLESLGYKVHSIPHSGLFQMDDKHFIFGYINSLTLGDLVLVPKYQFKFYPSATDGQTKRDRDFENAKAVYQKFFTHVVEIPITDFRAGDSAYGGAVHCLTTDIPKIRK